MRLAVRRDLDGREIRREILVAVDVVDARGLRAEQRDLAAEADRHLCDAPVPSAMRATGSDGLIAIAAPGSATASVIVTANLQRVFIAIIHLSFLFSQKFTKAL